jgi:type I site-specific restriction endonuclease
MPLTPEQEARQQIDAALEAAGWAIQSRAALFAQATSATSSWISIM